MFSAALSPSNTAAASKALEILREDPSVVDKVKENAKYLKQQFQVLGLDTMGTETCVIPVFFGDDKKALKACHDLLAQGVFATPVVHPAVPKGQALIRCSVMATHTTTDLDQAARAFAVIAPTILNKSDINDIALHALLDDQEVTAGSIW